MANLQIVSFGIGLLFFSLAISLGFAREDHARAGYRDFESADVVGVSKTAVDEVIVDRIKLPKFEQGYVPQGVAVRGNTVLVSAYVGGRDWAAHRCTLFEFDRKIRNYRGPVLVSQHCRHGGGLVFTPTGELVVSDLDRLFIVDLSTVDWTNNDGYQTGLKVREIMVSTDIKGGMTIGATKSGFWITRFTKELTERADFFNWDSLLEKDVKQLTRSSVVRSIEVPGRIQGIAIGSDKSMWLSGSQGDDAYLARIDLDSGNSRPVIYPAVGAIEGIGFDSEGYLWAASEGGTPQWKMKTYFPFLFRIDINKLLVMPKQ